VTIQEAARHAYRLLIDDLSGRRGLGPFVWADIEGEVVRREIKPAWCAILDREIRKAVGDERDRCAAIIRELPDWNDPEARGDAVFLIARPSPDPAEAEVRS
jgi:hypothetical protein